MMKFIKIVALLLVALLTLAACQSTPAAPKATEVPQPTDAPQTANEAQTIDESDMEEIIAELAGIVTVVEDDYISLSTEQFGDVHVNLTTDTLFEGDKPIVGAYIHVIYNGQMTRSLPAQITAMRVGCYSRTGTMTAVTAEGFTLQTELEEIIVNSPAELLEGLKDGMNVTVYFNGAMTMSLPAQIGAEHIVME